MTAFGLRVSTGQLSLTAVLIPACIVYLGHLDLTWLAVVVAVIMSATTTLTVHGHRGPGWIAAAVARRRRRDIAPAVPSESAVGSTVMPGDPVAVRWQGDHLVSMVELVPRPFTPTVIVGGKAFTDDVVDTRTVEQLLATYAPDLEADVVSAGQRFGRTAPASVVALYEQVIGPHPAPARRRTWIVLRALPERTRESAARRGVGIDGLASYLVAVTTRVADHLARNGIEARCAAVFDDFDRATAISFEREAWSLIKGRGTFTVAYAAAGGPDVWWSARAEQTVTRVSIRPGTAPSTTVLLTTMATPRAPRGFSCLHGGQRAALQGRSPTTDRHHELPIGSAGVLIGETTAGHQVHLPFDDADTSVNLGDATSFTQFVIRSAAAGAVVTLGPQFANFADVIGADVGPEAKIEWPTTTTYLGPRAGVERVTLRHDYIETPRHGRLPIRLISPREESRFQAALDPRS